MPTSTMQPATHTPSAPEDDRWHSLKDAERLRLVLDILRRRRIAPVGIRDVADLAERDPRTFRPEEKIDVALHNLRVLNPELPVTPDELAHLAGVSPRTCQRLYSIASLKFRLLGQRDLTRREGVA